MATRSPFRREEAALRACALAYPEATEEFPWGHPAFKVKGKIFLTMSQGESFLSLSVKLPLSGRVALALPFTSPTAYGLGKSGWVTARFAAREDVPTDMIKEWIDESYRAIAPKRVLALLETAEVDGEQESNERAPTPKKKLKTKPKRRPVPAGSRDGPEITAPTVAPRGKRTGTLSSRRTLVDPRGTSPTS